MERSIQTMSQHFNHMFHGVRCIVKHYPRAVILTSFVGLTAPWLVSNYNMFIAMGAGALPHNVFGWLVSTSFKPFGRETLCTDEYDRDANKETWLTDTTSIPERRGDRPRTGWHFLPHRQITKIPSLAAQERLGATFRKHADANPTLVEVVRSPHEKLVDAMVIHSSIPSPHKVADHALREIVHIHPTDHSLHIVLSPQDCKLVIDRGWGERHPLSGISAYIPLPKEYLMIYAPRDDEELEIVERIIVAGIGYMTNTGSTSVN